MNTSVKVDKQELIDWISELNDPAMLENIKMLKDGAEGKDWWNEISEAERAGIKRGLEDVKAGRVVSNEEFWKKYEHRL